jgi:hypothetical protein
MEWILFSYIINYHRSNKTAKYAVLPRLLCSPAFFKSYALILDPMVAQHFAMGPSHHRRKLLQKAPRPHINF